MLKSFNISIWNIKIILNFLWEILMKTGDKKLGKNLIKEALCEACIIREIMDLGYSEDIAKYISRKSIIMNA